MRLIDFYEIMLEKYKNNKDILLILLSGFVNLTGGKNVFKKLVINSVLFQEKIFLKFLYADFQEIKFEMINVIKILFFFYLQIVIMKQEIRDDFHILRR